MQVETRWAEPVVSDIVSVPLNNNNDHQSPRRVIEKDQQNLSVGQSPVPTGVFFPPQRVEPLDMARSHQQIVVNRQKTGYTQSATTDEHQVAAPYMQNRPIPYVKHPTDHSSVLFFFQRLWILFFALFISLPCVLLITVLLPICWLIRSILRLTCRYQCPVTPCSCSYLSPTDLFWFYHHQILSDHDKHDDTNKINSSSHSPAIAAAIFFLEGTINENSLKKLLVNRLITNSSRRGANIGRKLFPRFSQLVVSRLSGTMWLDYLAFSIDDHVQEIPCDIQSDADLQNYVSTLVSKDLTSTRPLWQLHYKNRLSARNQDSVLVFLYHPVLSDGISLIRILLKHVVDNRTTQLDIKPRFVGRHGERVFDYLKAYLFGHRLIFSKLFFNSLPTNFFNRTVLNRENPLPIDPQQQQQLTPRVVVWSEPFSLTQANRMKLVTRTRMNDLLSTLIISTVKLYMERNGISQPPDMNCVIPCDLRSNSANIIMGNNLSHLCLEIPMNIEGNIPVLWSFNDTMKRVKEEGDYATMYLFTQITYLLFPLCLANKIIARVYNSASLWLTTLAAGSSTALATMSICNRDVRSLICLSPSVGTASISFCVTSYADELRLAVTADANLIPNANFFTECFIEQLNIVHDLLAHRRIPGEIRRIIRPPRILPPKKSISSISDMSEDLSIEEIQAKMSTLQQELLSLKSQFENVDADDPTSQNQRLVITSKLEDLRREFRELLIKLQERQCELSGMIPSDEEDEMDPHVRVRLRSASVASKISLRSNDQRLLSAKMYSMDREEGSEFGATIFRPGPSSSKTSLSAQPLSDQQGGMRRAHSVTMCDNPPIGPHQRKSVDHSRPVTPLQPLSTTTNTTIIQLDPHERWRSPTGNS